MWIDFVIVNMHTDQLDITLMHVALQKLTTSLSTMEWVQMQREEILYDLYTNVLLVVVFLDYYAWSLGASFVWKVHMSGADPEKNLWSVYRWKNISYIFISQQMTV